MTKTETTGIGGNLTPTVTGEAREAFARTLTGEGSRGPLYPARFFGTPFEAELACVGLQFG